MTNMHEGAGIELARRLAALATGRPLIENIDKLQTLADEAYQMLEGDLSPMAVEICMVRQDNDGCEAVGDIARANMFSVYIRNPLSFHIEDFPRAAGWPDVQREEAFFFAHALAEHLQCDVLTDIARFPAAPAVISEFQMAEAAACLWEAILAARSAPNQSDGMEAAFDNLGTSAIRAIVIGWADKVHHDWQEAQRLTAYCDAFDWEFVPDWLGLNVSWLEHGPTLARVRRLPQPSGAGQKILDPSLVPMLIDQFGLDYEMVGGGARILSHTFGNDWSISVTCLDGGALPRPDSWHVGVYQPDNDGSAIWEWRSDDKCPTMNLSQALGAGWAIGGEA